MAASAQEEKIELDKFLGALFITNADKGKYGSLQDALVFDSQLGEDHYPKSLFSAYELLCCRGGRYDSARSQTSDQLNQGGRGDRGVTGRYTRAYEFLQQQMPAGTTLVAGRDGTTTEIQCYRCQSWGHLANNCPNGGRNRKGTNCMQCIFTQDSVDSIPSNWVLLDTCSTVSVGMNPDLFGPISLCDNNDVLTIRTNGGCIDFTHTCEFQLLPIRCHFNSNSMANILSMKDVINLDGVCVTMDSSVDRAITVQYEDMMMKFRECSDGLYYFDTAADDAINSLYSYSFLSTVNDNTLFLRPLKFKERKTQDFYNNRLVGQAHHH